MMAQRTPTQRTRLARNATLATHFAVALTATLLYKFAVFLYTVSGAEGRGQPLRTFAKLWLCLGWDVVAALAVSLIAFVMGLALARSPRTGFALGATLQSVHAVFLAVSYHVQKVIGAPLDKSVIDLAFFNSDPTAGRPLGQAMSDSIAPYFMPASLFGIGLAAALPVLALLFRAHWPAVPRLAARVTAALLVACPVFTCLALPHLRTGEVAGIRIHTFGLERSPLVLLAGSYAQQSWRQAGTRRAKDPFCVDLRSVVGDVPASSNPILDARLPDQPTNLLMIVLESVGTVRLLRDPSVMPFLMGLRGSPRALWFEQHYSHWPQTMKSMFTMLCSELPYPDYASISHVNPAIPCVSLPQALEGVGYRTAFIHSGDFAYERKLRFLKHRRFDTLLDMYTLPGRDGAWSTSWGVDEDVTIGELLRWIDARRSARVPEPFFALYWMVAGHHPYSFPGMPDFPEHERRPGGKAHLATLRYVDAIVGRLVDEMDRRGALSDTLVAIVSDHGPDSGRGMDRARDATIYEPALRVPLILIGPQIQGGRSVEFVTSQLDLAPTLLGLVGQPVPITMKGRNLRRDTAPRVVILGSRPPIAQFGARDGRWKYIASDETGARELFDLQADPDERRDVATTHPEIVRRLGGVVDGWREQQRDLIENYASLLRGRQRPCDPGPAR